MKPPVRIHLFRKAHWMLFGLVACLVITFWLAGHKFGKKIEDTYRDPHRMAALETFEQAIVVAAPGESAESPIAAEALADKFKCAGEARRARLVNQLQTLQAKLRVLSRGSGKTLRLDLERWPPAGSDCADVLEATDWLTQGRRLEDTMDWPGLRKTQFDTVMRVPESVFQQDNPWRGADGCVYLGPTTEGKLLFLEEQRRHRDTCPAMAPAEFRKDRTQPIARPKDKDHRYALASNDMAWAIPEDLGAILADLGRIRRPEGVTYGDYTQLPDPAIEADPAAAPSHSVPHGPNRLSVGRREADVGFSVYLTLDPAAQRLVQSWARCYAGDRHACEVAGLDRNDPLGKLSGEMYETAAVRMTAVALIDVATGRIEALGSAHTPCYGQDHGGPSHDAGCPDAPFRPRYDPDRLLNHAVYVDALPASTVKPILALGFLMDNPGFRSGTPLQELQHDLKTSNSPDFLDRLFCVDNAGGPRPRAWQDCQRSRRVQEAASQLGWNLECKPDQFSPDCAGLDVLFGRPAGKRITRGKPPLGLAMLYGRLFVEPVGTGKAAPELPADDWNAALLGEASGGHRLVTEFRYDENFARDCSAGRFCPDCEKGHARWRRCKGIGGQVANEGWGQGEARATALGVAGMIARLAAAANDAKEQRFPHLIDHIGDANGQPFSVASERLAGPAPIDIDPALAGLVLQGMTSHQAGGTADDACEHVFGRKRCDGIDWIAGKTGTPPFRFDRTALGQIRKTCASEKTNVRSDLCNVIPYKWFVAAFKTKRGGYDKAIAVLTERNWRKKNGLVQAPGDLDTNLSAELAFRIIKALRREPDGSPPVPASGKKGKP